MLFHWPPVPPWKTLMISDLSSSLDHVTLPRSQPRKMARRQGLPAKTTGPWTPPWARPSRRPGSTRWTRAWRSPRSLARTRSPFDPLVWRKRQLRCPQFWESELWSLESVLKRYFQALTILYERLVQLCTATSLPGYIQCTSPCVREREIRWMLRQKFHSANRHSPIRLPSLDFSKDSKHRELPQIQLDPKKVQ